MTKVTQKTIFELPEYNGMTTPLSAQTMFIGASVFNGLRRTNLQKVYDAYESCRAPTYEQQYCNISLAGRKLYYPTICQAECKDPIRWRAVLTNNATNAAYNVRMSDESGRSVSCTVQYGVNGPNMAFLYWPYGEISGYLSVVNSNANVDVLLQGRVVSDIWPTE